MRKLTGLFLLGLLAVIGLMPVSAQTASLAFIRVGHFSPDAAEVDIYLDGELSSVQALPYGNVTTWMGIPSGIHTVDVVPTGEAVDASLGQVEVELAPDSWTTLSAVGSGNGFIVQPAVEDYKTPIERGEARFTVFHAIEGMSGVDLTRNNVALISTVTYPNPALGNDGAASVEVAAGTYTYAITGAGRASAVLLTLPDTEVPAGSYISVFVFGTLEEPVHVIQTVSPDDVDTVRSGGTLEDTAEEIATVPDVEATPLPVADGDPAYIRVAHMSVDAGAVDIFLNGEASAVTNLEVGTVTDWMVVPSGTYVVDVVPAGGALDASVYDVEVELEVDSWTTLSAVGTGNGFMVQPAVEDYKTPIQGGEARFTVFHGIEGMTGVDLVRNGVALISTVTYPSPALGNDGAASVEVAAGTFTYQITGAGRTSAVITTLPDTEVPAGSYIALFVYGELNATQYTIAITTPDQVNALMQ